MSATLGKIARTITTIIHTREVQHDVALFAGTLVATGIVGDLAGGVPLRWDALAALLVTAARRAAVLRLAGK